MHLLNIIRRDMPPKGKASAKIPWNDPGFSRRMLACHLAQEHDWASRRESVIARQIAHIAQCLPGNSPAVLDLGCGPGLYTRGLARIGFRCLGVDFSPASVEYAREDATRQGLVVRYELADIREYAPKERHDAVLLLFGEINVFSREEGRALVAKAASALVPGGRLFLEAHVFTEVREQGLRPPSWQALETGLFSERPHFVLDEHFWDEDKAVATTRYYVMDAHDAGCTEYLSRMAAYTEKEYRTLLSDCGIENITAARPEDWPVGEDFQGKLVLYTGTHKNA